MKVLIRYTHTVRNFGMKMTENEYGDRQDSMMLDVAHPNDIRPEFEKEVAKRNQRGATMQMWLPEDKHWFRK